MTCEGLNRDIEFNSVENYWEHHGYFCHDCLKRFSFFDRKTNWNDLEAYVGLIPKSKGRFCDKCLTFGGEKKEGIYSPYFTCEDYFYFLQDHLTYCTNHSNCPCYWPEVNKASGEICDISFDLFSNLFSTTALIQVVNSREKQREMLLATPTNASRFSLHGLVIAILSKSFFYSHYYRICQDIDRYSKQTFNEHKYAIIQNKLEYIIFTLREKYLQLYKSCLKKHPNKRIELEYSFIKSELNMHNQALFSLNFDVLEDNLTNNFSEKHHYPEEETEETFNLEECPFNISPLSIKAKKIEDFHQMRWLESQVLLKQGSLLNQLLLYKDSIDILSKAIKKDTLNIDAYIERAFAYFETNQLSLALKDYKSAKKLAVVAPFKPGVKGHYSPENKVEFTEGLLSGIIAGAKISTVEFVPSMLSCCRGILNGLWAFACSPIEVSKEITDTAYAIGEFISRNSTSECLQCVVPELRELALSWDKLKDHSRGEKIGFIIGKYGVDIFAPIAVLKGVNKIKALRKANTMFTLESCIASQEKQAKILGESVKRASIREVAIAESIRESKILVKSSNVAPHVMQNKHAWNKFIALTGDVEKDFQAVLIFLEENEVFAAKCLFESENFLQGKIIRGDYRKIISGYEVQAVFETYVETTQTFLKDAWVITK